MSTTELRNDGNLATCDIATTLLAPAPVRARRRVRRTLSAAVRIITTTVLIAAVAVFAFLAVGPRFLGYQTSTMLTGSMAPLINPGDVVVSTKTPTAELKIGDIITYNIPVQDHRVETHRIATLTRNAGGTTTVTTKGDANNGPDPWSAVLTDNYVYTTTAVIPHLGDGIRALRDPMVRAILLYGAPAIIVTALLISLWRKPASGPLADTAGDAEGGDHHGDVNGTRNLHGHRH